MPRITKGDKILMSEIIHKMFVIKQKMNNLEDLFMNIDDFSVIDFITFFENIERIYIRHKKHQIIKVLQLKRRNLKKILETISAYKKIFLTKFKVKYLDILCDLFLFLKIEIFLLTFNSKFEKVCLQKQKLCV